VFAHPRTNRFVESEFAVPRDRLRPALEALRTAIDGSGMRISFPIEVRFAPADEVWLSTAYRRDSAYIAVHRYWRDDADALLRMADQVLRTFDGRPHWGKVHQLDAADLRARYPRFDDFLRLRDDLDPGRMFTNDHLAKILGP
jgi:FAD/FMN-containing dehydrogenase